MPQHTRLLCNGMLSWLRNNKVAPVATFFVLVLHLVQVPKNEAWDWSGWIGMDKLAHFILFGTLTVLWLLFPWKKAPSGFALFLYLMGYAISLEIMQSGLTSYRSGELMDLVYDALAVIVVLTARKKFIPR